MSATARELPDADLNDTIAYECPPEPGRQPPMGSPEMPKPAAPQGHHRYTFSSGSRPLDGYTIKRAIGRGGFGEVYYATSDSGKEVALKLILHNLEVERRGVVQCMNLKCPNLLTIYDLKSDESGDTFVVMEYVAGPSLAQVLARHPDGLPLAEVRAWLKGLVEGVAYLHDHGIVHRDLKPANLFMEEGIVKIGDYGLAKLIHAGQETGHSESIGTCHYMAPEIASGKYHKPIDIYAIGVILYEMLTGRVPFEGETVGEILMKHLTARPDLSQLPEPYQTIVARALAKDPAERPGRVHELLPPEDAPQPADVRFIGAGQVAPTPPPTAAVAPEVAPGPKAEEEEEILRIGPEEPVFYIGPDTRPPHIWPMVHKRIWAKWTSAGCRPRAAAARQAPAVETRPGAAPPPLPAGRIRVAELASSMLWAAVTSALLGLAAGALLGLDVQAAPQQVAHLIVMALLGTWSVLAAGKVTEGRPFDPNARRLLSLANGLVLGIVGLVVGWWLRVDPLANWWTSGPPPAGDSRLAYWTVFGEINFPEWYAFYFGLLFLANGGWAKLAARDRKARFRALPVLGTALIAALLYGFLPFSEPSGIAMAVLIAVVTQLVSPWSEAAADARRARNRRFA